MPFPLAVAVVPAAATGAFAQRVSGLGFSLITAPALALAAGPRDGIALTNLLAILVALTVFVTSARHVDTARCMILIPAGLIGVIPGAIVFRLLPASPLQVTVGSVTGVGLAAVVIASRRPPQPASNPGSPVHPGPPAAPRAASTLAAPRLAGTAVAGLASGFSTAVAGAGGPALTVYAVATNWPQPEFAATGQINYALQAAAALGLKGVPALPAVWLGAAVAAVLGGLAAGQLLAHRIGAAHARRAAIAIAALATTLTVIHGALS